MNSIINQKNEKTKEILNKAKRIYINELKVQTENLEQLVGDVDHQFHIGQAKEIYRIVHMIKGSAPMFGLSRAGKIAEQLVDLWEWVNKGKSEIRIAELISLTSPLLFQLKVEYEIHFKELEEGIQEQLGVKGSDIPSSSRILLIDDDQVLLNYLKGRLELTGYQVDEADLVNLAVKKLQSRSYDVIILDLMMYPQSGYDLFHFVKDDPKFKWIPIIVLSGRDQVDDKVRCLHLGADDYVTKPFHFEELEARICNLLNRVKFFEQMAFRDALTGVYNRRYFDHEIQMEMQRTQRYGKSISLAFIDIDNFKLVNDHHGHQVGDLVLQGLAHILQQQMRNTDILARYGGEEFVIIFPETMESQAVDVLNRIIKLVRDQPIIQNEGLDFYITISAGLAEWKKGMSGSDWIQLADEALYKAKQKGRDQVVLSTGKPESAKLELGNMRKQVLIADDDSSIRSLLISILQKMPVDILEVADGIEAWKILQSHDIDLCILDGVMPKEDGFSLLKKLRENASLRYIKVMMLSARKNMEDLQKGFELGADEYISKPFSLVELEVRIKRMLGMLN